ncbi:hypothetical protein NP493_1158g00049 [Ridgeia piscesae]|uniref:DUF6729 domain-containing protein n=1 Tax=Ridgeia piscesae TaxID=27915 RepID=A0AAD9KEH0_RIDPI|nr:hypothetical protein NP493_1158g00049 [Ridgeia piscesae]
MTQPVSTDQEVQDQCQPVIERVLCARRYRDKRWYKVKWGDLLGRGQRPRRNSYWARTLEGIEKCPRHRSAATHDLFGRPLACKCSVKAQLPRRLRHLVMLRLQPLLRRHGQVRLPEGWKSTVRVLDQAWIGRALFVSGPAKGKARDVLTTNLANWWHPPRLVHTARPTLAAYFARRLFLWMLRKMWHMRVTCPNCGTDEELRSKGLYRRVRHVIDVTDVYYLAAEYMDCRSC